jgi:hypothetical protein
MTIVLSNFLKGEELAEDNLSQVLNLGIDKATLVRAGDGIFWFFIVLIILAIVTFTIIFIWLQKQYKHPIRMVDMLRDNQHLITDTMAREIKIDGVIFWNTKAKQRKFEVPPSDVLTLNSKGKKCLVIYYDHNGNYHFGKDTVRIGDPDPSLFLTPENINEDALPEYIRNAKSEEEKQALLKNFLTVQNQQIYDNWKKENKIIDSYEPITTKHRMIVVHQVMKAAERRGKSWGDYLMPIAGGLMLLIMFVAMLVFWGDLAKPVLEQGQTLKDTQISQERQAVALENALKIIQRLESNSQNIESQSMNNINGEPPN